MFVLLGILPEDEIVSYENPSELNSLSPVMTKMTSQLVDKTLSPNQFDKAGKKIICRLFESEKITF